MKINKSEWEKRKLGEVCEVKSGKSLKENIISNNKNDIPYIKVAELNMPENTHYITTSIRFVNLNNIDYKNIIPAKSIVFPKRGGAIATNKKRILSCDIVADLNIMAIIPSDKIDSDYLYFFMNNINMAELSNGSSVPQINNNDILPLKIMLPSLDEQKYIAKILDTISDIINLHKKSIEELDKLIQSTFYDMFGDPIINDMGWDVGTLGVVAPSKQAEFISSKEVWLLNLDEIESNTGNILNYKSVSSDEIASSTIKFNNENVLYSKLRPYLNKVVAPNKQGYATSEIVPLKPNRNYINRIYLLELLKSDVFVNLISEKTSGAKMPRVVMSEFYKLEISIPPFPLQEKFANIVNHIEEQKTQVNKALENSQTLFNSLMQEFFE